MGSKGDDAQKKDVEIFLRVKPVKNPSRRVIVDTLENKIEFNVPRAESAGLVNNKKEQASSFLLHLCPVLLAS